MSSKITSFTQKEHVQTKTVAESYTPTTERPANMPFEEFAKRVVEDFKNDMQQLRDEEDKPLLVYRSGSSFTLR